MKQNPIAIIIVFAFLLLMGCALQLPGQGATASISSAPEKTCPASCDDLNPCTKDSCSKQTDYRCVHGKLEGQFGNCSGFGRDCSILACSAGKCIEEGNPAQCTNDSGCDDSDNSTKDVCELVGNCDASCSHAPITGCGGDDSFCPAGCGPANDSDCGAATAESGCNINVKDRACPQQCSGLNDADCPLYRIGENGYSKDNQTYALVSLARCDGGTLELRYKVYNVGEYTLAISNENIYFCQYNNVNCRMNANTFYDEVPPGYSYERVVYFDRCSSEGRFAINPTGYPGDEIPFKVEAT